MPSPSPRPRQLHHVVRRGPSLCYCEHVSRPCVERSALLGCPIVALVHAGDAAAAAADVVQHRFGYFEPNAYVLQAGGDGSAQIVSGRV